MSCEARELLLPVTEIRRRCTGESHQSLYPLCRPGTTAVSIASAATREQAELEAAVFFTVCKIGGVSAHPLGIHHVRPQAQRLTIRLLAEPGVIRYWAEMLLPRDNIECADPRDRVGGVCGLRSRTGNGGVHLYRPGHTGRLLLTGFPAHWWDRVTQRVQYNYTALFTRPVWTPIEQAAYATLRASALEPPLIGSPLLRRIRATAGPGPVNSTDAWTTLGGIRLETTDGPPCDEFIRLFTDGPCGLGWQVETVSCACHRGREEHLGCMVDFRMPNTEQYVYYSNLRWNRTMDARRRELLAEMNQRAFTD
ncbi:hypothetical protein ACFCY8_18110 [Streptomyces noursei]|uniref:hypothetical protein n=1 Tax=Streptomyces noursei TaxID=1971 RepID=UPI0035DDCA80